jgi:hypothetical protein
MEYYLEVNSVRRKNICDSLWVYNEIDKKINTCSNETYNEVRVRGNISDASPIQNRLKMGDDLS